MLKSFGCSFIFGNDLSDDGRDQQCATASALTWPALLAQQNDLPYVCYAKGGAGNFLIMDRALKHIGAGGDDVYVIGWTWSSRFDYNLQAHHLPNGFTERFHQFEWQTITPTDDHDLARIYYRDIQSEYRDVLASLSQMLTVLTVLHAKRLRYVMTNLDPILFDQRWRIFPGVTALQQAVKPYITDFDGQDFLTWSRNQGFDISANLHPLEPAHAAAAGLLAARFDTILRRA